MKFVSWMQGGIFLLTIPAVALAQAPDAAKAGAAAQATEKSKMTVASDIQVQALWDGRKIMPFKALDFPKMVKAEEADFLTDKDYVLGVTVNGESRAYPTRFVWWHHIINDKAGKAEAGGEKPYVVTYCSVCNTGVRYDPRVAGKTLKFDFYGLYNGVVTMCERETESIFLTVTGRAVTGEMVNTQLKPQPMLDTTWGQWKKLHPETLVMWPDPAYSSHYSPVEKPEPRGYAYFPAPFFRPSVTRGDKRLPAFEKVLAVTIPDAAAGQASVLARAYPLQSVQKAGGIVNDTLGTTPVGVFLDPETMTAVAVSRLLDGKTLTFEHRTVEDKPALFDRETGTRWTIEGVGIEGPLAQKTLTRLDNHLSQWYGWAAYFPETSIYGRQDAPQPTHDAAELDALFPPAPKRQGK